MAHPTLSLQHTHPTALLNTQMYLSVGANGRGYTIGVTMKMRTLSLDPSLEGQGLTTCPITSPSLPDDVLNSVVADPPLYSSCLT